MILCLQKISLHFIVLSFDRYSRDDIIGELTCALSSVPGLEDADNQEISLCRKICPRNLKVNVLVDKKKKRPFEIVIVYTRSYIQDIGAHCSYCHIT